jgi:hypothetical protein
MSESPLFAQNKIELIDQQDYENRRSS